MGKNKKRKRNAVSIDDVTSENERAQSFPSEDEESPEAFQGVKARIDPTTGLRAAFPGLDDDGGGELFYGPASDGLEYLRMVRSEAKGVPHLLVAPKETEGAVNEELYNSGYGDMRGYYQDGAYTALPAAHSGTPDAGGTEEEDPQKVYYESLNLRYRLLRAKLRIPPPSEVLAALDDSHPISFSTKSRRRFSKMRYCLRNTDPLPGQVAAFDQQTVLKLIRSITCHFLKRNHNIKLGVARWIWVLLGRLEEVGCLSSEEVSVVRDLGKRAVSVLVGIEGGSDDDEQIRNAEDADGEIATRSAEGDLGVEADYAEEERAATTTIQTDKSGLEKEDGAVCLPNEVPSTGKLKNPSNEDVEEGKISDDIAPDRRSSAQDDEASPDNPAEAPMYNEEDFGAAKERLLARLPSATASAGPKEDEQFPSVNTTATLDMIITIVGEHYGQRDLLEFREIW